MSSIIEDGTGQGFFAKVDSDNRLRTSAVSEDGLVNGSELGNAFNVNTEFIPLSGSGEQPILYFKNNGSKDVVISNWFIGIGFAGGSGSEAMILRAYTNPTGGTLITSGTDVVPVNRRIGDGKVFRYDVKKGDGSTSTLTGYGATPVLYQTQGPNSRVFGTINLTLPQGSSLGITVDMNGYEPANIYTGFIGYERTVGVDE